MHLRNIVSGRNYIPLNKIEISLFNLKSNYKYLSGIDKNIKIAPVLKSNAYGHGLSLVAKAADGLKAPFFCVDSLYEAYELLKIGIKTQVLIMGYVNPKSLQTKKLPFSFAVYDYERINALNQYQPSAKIHIFVDSGMHREGISLKDLPQFLKYIKSKTNLEIEGLMSHLAMSDKPQNPLTKKQVDNFTKARKMLENFDINPKWIHLGNSSALLNNKKYGLNLGNMARVGLAFYGIDPQGKNKKLKPVLSLKTHVSQIKTLRKNESVGYDFTFVASKNMKIATIPIGYYDGVDRRLSNKGYVLVNNKYCKIIGRVSMNITTIDVSRIKNIKVGDEVTVYSSRREDKNSIENYANLCSTIPYDLLVHLASSTKRVIAL